MKNRLQYLATGVERRIERESTSAEDTVGSIRCRKLSFNDFNIYITLT
jgi:hypothetical protein